MEARSRWCRQILCLAVVAWTAVASEGASARSQNFIVTAATKELAVEIATAAETYRRDLALEWLGDELPNWEQPCPITAQVGPRLGAGGATSFIFGGGNPHSWTMSIQGSRERVLDSVLPHEVTHTIFASHFRRALPRWADEGACTTVEHASERGKQEKLLYQFLTTNRGIPFNRMFAMKEYPQDILPLYSQGYALARYMIALGGKRKFVDYVGAGMESNNWTAATKKFYGFHSLSDLQLSWLEWVRTGTPVIESAADVAYRSADPSRNGRTLAEINGEPATAAVATTIEPIAAEEPAQVIAARNSTPTIRRQVPSNQLAIQEPAPAATPITSGWYARKRDQAQSSPRDEQRLAAQPREFSSRSRPQPPEQVRQTLLEWSQANEALMPAE